ncbi:hypothetical protein SAMN04487995_4196 [Dyadobacter koreensis]|uniref:Uncharacterized protein n=1 Tax=Dyadobacter koreensis TaxID=408657 RepID=A0A1H6XTA6_9BACT|nr:hypothetical protein [Dyadobacter koreensis]SEJ32293.1 hypothetical protein SAMN04487995_4196 [Dyadobacter koreensis]
MLNKAVTTMDQDTKLSADYIDSQIGNIIEYYDRWEFGEEPFFGKARIKGLADDEFGKLRIICEVLEGSDLELAYEEEDNFVHSDNRPIYAGAPPFEIYSANWITTDGKKKKQTFISLPNENARAYAAQLTNSKVVVKRIY